MAYPAGVSLAVLTTGSASDFFGSDAAITATVTPVLKGTSHIVHAATGAVMVPAPQVFTAEAGEGISFSVPHTDQDGWLDGAGNAYKGWYYKVALQIGSGRTSGPQWTKTVAPVLGQALVDLDLVAGEQIGEPVSAPVAAVTSIAGLTGAVTEEQLQALGLGEDVPVEETSPGTYKIGSIGVVQGLTLGQRLPDAAKTDLSTEIKTTETDIGAAVAQVADAGIVRAKPSLDAAYSTKMPKALNSKDYGAHGENTVDNVAFKAMMLAARDGRRTAPDGLMTDPLGTYVLDLPAGDFRITDIQGLMGAEATSVKTRGLRIRGAGINLTHIIFDPLEPGILAYNRYWQSIRFEGMTFSTTKPGSTFMQSNAISGSAPQDFAFTDVQWSGPWKYLFDLQGTNNNSEFRFIGCGSTGMQADGAWLYAGTTNTSDQFLNYWFYACKHQNTDAALVDMAKGGHIHLFGVDCSAWGNTLTSPRYLLNLRGRAHSYGVMSMTAHGLRVEPKNNYAGLLYSQWPEGNIELQCDWSSQVPAYTYGDIIHMDLENTPGAILNVHDSFLAGGVKVTYTTNAFQRQQSMTFRNCVWKQRLSPSEVVSYDESGAGSNRVRPAVHFINCRDVDNQNPYVTTGASVWDATIGFNRGPLVKTSARKTLVLRGIYGNQRASDGPLRFNLPVGALITGVRAVAPPTDSTDADGGSWTISTREATPTTVATVAVTGPMNAGYNIASDLTVPFHCNTRDRANIVLTATGIAQAHHEAFLTVEGYW